jgi:hypothetical protein
MQVENVSWKALKPELIWVVLRHPPNFFPL